MTGSSGRTALLDDHTRQRGVLQDYVRIAAKIGTSDLDSSTANLGGAVFEWPADPETSFTVPDTYVEAGGDFLVTADTYSARVAGNSGGASESMNGPRTAARGNRGRMIITTGVGPFPGPSEPGATTVTTAVDASPCRLRSDHIDLLRARFDDRDTPPAREGMPALPYYGLATGFLTGKCRPDVPRAAGRGRAAPADDDR
ncbi:aldo/keto reductase [Kutzneria kofuensis]|uniref:aldo/keto reductase n=1 Tax=Kutzneria kofuensis TaxID=103725 RepID=UPI0031EAEB42